MHRKLLEMIIVVVVISIVVIVTVIIAGAWRSAEKERKIELFLSWRVLMVYLTRLSNVDGLMSMEYSMVYSIV